MNITLCIPFQIIDKVDDCFFRKASLFTDPPDFNIAGCNILDYSMSSFRDPRISTVLFLGFSNYRCPLDGIVENSRVHFTGSILFPPLAICVDFQKCVDCQVSTQKCVDLRRFISFVGLYQSRQGFFYFIRLFDTM